ncbi:MAG: biotin--[acetyl-CoA-carboxylase] ligase [Bacteroidetes bacterium]|nr:biotin--[acetyl-CoA-carboxylase] ligase [Bacteroidota bacterium]
METFRFAVTELESTHSTNDYLKSMDLASLPAGFCVVAHYQTAGRGQRQKQWLSLPGQNLTCSFLLKGLGLKPTQQIALLKAVSLSVKHCVADLTGATVRIKWPNDIMVGREKIAGLLIENFIQAGDLVSVVGLGLNVNQARFPAFCPQATSLCRVSGHHHPLPQVLLAVEYQLAHSLAIMKSSRHILDQMFASGLYAMGQTHEFESPGQGLFSAVVVGVDALGRLLLQQGEQIRAYLNGEIQWVF